MARENFMKGKRATETCLRIDPWQPLCKLFLGSVISTISSMDGIVAALRNARAVEKLWMDVMTSDVNYHFYPSITLQGSARYGLGMFYRLIPDYSLVRWLFDVQGNLDKSIKMHREAIALDGSNACSNMMLAASLLCKVKGDRSHVFGQEGFAILDRVATGEAVPFQTPEQPRIISGSMGRGITPPHAGVGSTALSKH